MSRASVRRQRGNNAVNWLAEYYQGEGWPGAAAIGSGRNGADLLGMPGLSVEVKATEEMRLESWLGKAEGRAGLAYAVWMPPGYGRAGLGGWPAIMRTGTLHVMLDKTGLAMIAEWWHCTADRADVAMWAAHAPRTGQPVIMRYQGRGADEYRTGQWPAILPVAMHTRILREFGYRGDSAVTCRKRNTEES